MHGQRIHDASVLSRNYEEVVETDPVLVAVRTIQQQQLALVIVVLGVVLQILFPGALVFINADIAGNLIGLIGKFSGAGLIGLIAAGVVIYLMRRQ